MEKSKIDTLQIGSQNISTEKKNIINPEVVKTETITSKSARDSIKTVSEIGVPKKTTSIEKLDTGSQMDTRKPVIPDVTKDSTGKVANVVIEEKSNFEQQSYLQIVYYFCLNFQCITSV